jgi:small subunit ribosomal protein S6
LREYETVMVLDATLDETRVDEELETVNKIITGGGGEVLDVQRWGRRRLAYEIQKKREGIYSLVRFKSEPPVLDELERVFRLNDSLLRHLTVLSRGPSEIPGYDERDRDDDRHGDRRGGRNGEGRDRGRRHGDRREHGDRPRSDDTARKPAEQKPAEQKPAEQKAAEQKSADDAPASEAPAGAAPAGGAATDQKEQPAADAATPDGDATAGAAAESKTDAADEGGDIEPKQDS